MIDLMRNPSSYIANGNNNSNVPVIMWPEQSIPNTISLLFTKDYNVVAPRRSDKPFQGGFFMLKPSKETYQEMIEIVRKGDYTDKPNKKGWGGKVGPFHGGMTIQGLLPWYYEYLHQDASVELNRCVYNNMADNPTSELSINDIAQGRCRTNEEVGRAPVLYRSKVSKRFRHCEIAISYLCLVYLLLDVRNVKTAEHVPLKILFFFITLFVKSRGSVFHT
jgi:hypothetical protein